MVMNDSKKNMQKDAESPDKAGEEGNPMPKRQ